MNNRIFPLLFCFICTFSTLLGQQDLRQRVAVVRPVYQPSTVTFLTNFSSSLEKEGYGNAARMINAYLKGGFGSGFVVADKRNNNTYLITNKHVVAHAEKVTVEFTEPDKSTETYTDCPVIAIDENLDLAAVALPQGVKRDKAFDISETEPKDGDEVYSAGYPGLGNNPAWQLGKGIISNSEAFIDELKSQTANTAIIQHTAQIDPGSSGGPLMVRTVAGNYRVVGINTWKASGTSTMNMAIPARAIRTFIDENIFSEKTQTTETLKLRVNDFIAAAQTDYHKTLPFVSYGYIQDITVEAFFNLLNTLPEKVRDEVHAKFKAGNPVEGLRIGLASMLSRQIVAKNASFSAIDNFTSTAEPVNVMLKYGASTVNSTWVEEQGRWRIRNFAPLKINPHGKQGVDSEFGYANSYRLGLGVPFVAAEGLVYSLIYANTKYTFMTYDARINAGHTQLIRRETNNTTTHQPDTPKDMRLYVGIDLSWGAQLPLKINATHIAPHLKGIISYDIGDKIRRLGGGFAIGGDVAYRIKKGLYLIAGIEYRHKFYLKNNDQTLYEQFAPVPSIGINAGIAF